jgi:hypothetical protein
MESHSSLISHESWGRVAAQSHFSWPRAIVWLEQGRPLSHIALFAIRACFYYDTIPLRKVQPQLEEPETVETMIKRLEEYYQIDPVPRVRNLILSIKEMMTDAEE